MFLKFFKHIGFNSVKNYKKTLQAKKQE